MKKLVFLAKTSEIASASAEFLRKHVPSADASAHL